MVDSNTAYFALAASVCLLPIIASSYGVSEITKAWLEAESKNSGASFDKYTVIGVMCCELLGLLCFLVAIMLVLKI
jgi:F0F1-type ATP synthase membrane subunit c/vacuolar-type H+-ATPase subunit K